MDSILGYDGRCILVSTKENKLEVRMKKTDLKKLGKEELQKLAQEAIGNCNKNQLINFLLGLEPVKPKIKVKDQPVIFVMDDSGIVKKHSNDGKTQTIIFKCNDRYWKLIIHSESYDFQSYIRLYTSSTLDNWNLVKKGNPKKDYNIDISYIAYSQNVFSPIIEDYKKVIERFR